REEKNSTKKQKKAKYALALPPEPRNIYFYRMLAAGCCAGALPLIHAHTFLVVMGVAACLTILFHSTWRSWLVFFGSALIVSLPEVLWLAHTGGVKASSYLGWLPGWDHGNHNVLWFWLVNTGLFIPLLIVSLVWRGTNLKLSPRLFK